jgi:hypothetical protein
LIEAGYRDQPVIAHAICFKTCLLKYGGDGYEPILKNVVPVMRRKGMSEDDIAAILVYNPPHHDVCVTVRHVHGSVGFDPLSSSYPQDLSYRARYPVHGLPAVALPLRCAALT